MDYICDTNVWYDIGAGILDPAKLKAGGNRLFSPALNALEISSNLSDRTLASRKLAAQAILDHADSYLEDPERYMGTIWGLNLPPLGVDWKSVCRTIVASNDVFEMVNGTQKIMKINVVTARAWRSGFTQKFVTDVEAAIRTHVPKYATRRLHTPKSRMDYLKDPAKVAEFKSILHSAIVEESQILLTRTRASAHLDAPPPPATTSEIAKAKPELMPFVKAYLTLIEQAATFRGVFENDWGDLHCFIYLQGNRILLTGDDKWLAIASDAGMAHLVKDSKAI